MKIHTANDKECLDIHRLDVRRVSKIALALFFGLATGALAFTWTEVQWLAKYAWTSPTPRPLAPMSKPPPCANCHLVLVSLDTLRADYLGRIVDGVSLTPNLDRIRARGLDFSRAYTPGFFTTPAHMSVFTGLYPLTHRVQSRDVRGPAYPDSSDLPQTALNQNIPTLAEVLRKNGFETSWFGPTHSKFLDFGDGFSRGFDHIANTAFARGTDLPGVARGDFQRESLLRLSRARRQFVFLHSYITHSPFLAPEGLVASPKSRILYPPRLLPEFQSLVSNPRLHILLTGQADTHFVNRHPDENVIRRCTDAADLTACFAIYDGDRDPFWHALGALQTLDANKIPNKAPGAPTFDEERKTFSAAYQNAVRELDLEIGRFWTELERLKVLDRTMVVFFSDHGEELLDHGGYTHSNFYEHTARAVLFMHHPRAEATSSDQLVNLVDILPMLGDTLALKDLPTTQGVAPWREITPYTFGASLGSVFVTDGRWKLIREHTGREELYNLYLDPTERQDVIAFRNPFARNAYTRLRAELRAWESGQATPVQGAPRGR